MKKTVTVLCSAILLSTSSYAGGKIEAVSEVEPVMHIESQEAVKNFYAG